MKKNEKQECEKTCETISFLKGELVTLKQEVQYQQIQSQKVKEDVDTSLKIISSISDFSDTKFLLRELALNFREISKSDFVTVYLQKHGKYTLVETNIGRIDTRKMCSDDFIDANFNLKYIEAQDTRDIECLTTRTIETKSIISIPVKNRTGDNIAIILAESFRENAYLSREMELSSIFATVSRLAIETSLTYERLKDIAYIDSIIEGAYNNQYFEKLLDDVLLEKRKIKIPFVISMLDIDKFKTVNDTFGHMIGNEVIEKIGQIILESIRENDYLIRFGGDEFIIIFYNTNDTKVIFEKIEEIREAICSYEFKTNNATFKTSCSFGLLSSEYLGTNDITSHKIIKEVDKGLYKSKEDGGNKTTILPLLH